MFSKYFTCTLLCISYAFSHNYILTKKFLKDGKLLQDKDDVVKIFKSLVFSRMPNMDRILNANF